MAKSGRPQYKSIRTLIGNAGRALKFEIAGEPEGGQATQHRTESEKTAQTMEAMEDVSVPATPMGAAPTELQEPQVSPGAHTTTDELIRMVEDYQRERYGRAFRGADRAEAIIRQISPADAQAIAERNESGSITHFTFWAKAEDVRVLSRQTVEQMGELLNVLMGKGMRPEGTITTAREMCVGRRADRTTIILHCADQERRVAHPTTITMRDDTTYTVRTLWNSRTTDQVTIAQPAYIIFDQNVDLRRISPTQCRTIERFVMQRAGPDFVVSPRGKPITWGDATDQTASALAKLWTTQKVMNILEANELTNRKLDNGAYIYTDKHAAAKHVKEADKPIPTLQRRLEEIRRMTTDGKLLTFKWHEGTEAEEATRRWMHELGCLEPEIIEMTESSVTAKILSRFVRRILTADMPTELRTVAVTQSKYSREALHDTERQLARAMAQQEAAATVAQAHAERLVASDAMQEALARAATAVAENRYHEQEAALEAQIQQELDRKSTEINMKRKLTEISK